MALSPSDETILRAAAEREGVDADELIAAARDIGGKAAGGGQSQSQGPKLYMYLLPYLRVSEVRQVFLGLTDQFPGDGEIASDWAAQHPIANADDQESST
jgi:hypothetical protein